MKILFLVHNLGKTRHFETVIDELTARNHTVVLAAARKRQKPLRLTERFADNPRIDVVPFPVNRVDVWKDHVRPLRQARDYMRFFDPVYAHATKLAERASRYAPPGWNARFERRPWLRRRSNWIRHGLEIAEAVVPSERFYELSILAEAPDLMLVTPLIDFGSYQTDYVKASHCLGLPVAFLPFSWDNLTNRGLIRIAPDRVLVWNQHQKREAVELHGVPADRVVMTGAPRFDEFFAMRASDSREAFCERAGLDPQRPILLYLCSSKFVAPREVDFVRQWVEALRRAPDPCLRRAAVLVRPHPANAEQWDGATVSGIEQVAVWRVHARMQGDQSLYDSLFHSAAVVGLNTSALIEAGIVGRPAYTIKTMEFAGGQEQTLHFHYVLAENGGLVETAATLEQHVEQMSAGLADPSRAEARNRRFIESFVRPHGIDRPVTPIVVDEIERLGTLHKRPRRPALWHYPARRALLALLNARAAR